MVKAKNISSGPRGVYSEGVLVMLKPGEERELDISQAELDASGPTGWFAFDAASSKDTGKAYDAMSDDQLRALLKDKGVSADGRWGRDKLVSEARKAL